MKGHAQGHAKTLLPAQILMDETSLSSPGKFLSAVLTTEVPK